MKSPFLAFLQWGAIYSSVTLAYPQDCHIPRLIDATAEQLQHGLMKGCFTSVDLVNIYVERIAEVNSTVKAVTELNPDAISIAKKMDEERKHGKLRGPLHGLPMLLKSNMFTDDKMTSTAGSYALFGARMPSDATVVTKLRDAGIIIMGKAAATQWANFRSTNSTSGWSAYGGQVTSAYYKNQDPSGSSSGSGVGSDLGLAFASLGTETSGSIVSPSDRNNIVGIKPTVGLTSRHFVIPISEHQDTVGPMARTVKDAAYLLQIIAGKDKNDNYTSAIPFSTIPNYVNACKLDSLKGKRIGVPRNAIKIFAPLKTVVDQLDHALAVMKQAGAIIVEDADYTALPEFANSSIPLHVLEADFYSNIKTLLGQLTVNPNKLTDLEDIRKFTQRSPLEAYPNRNTGLWDETIQRGLKNTDPAFWPLYQKNLKFGREGGILGTLRRHKLDAAVLPTPIAWTIPALVGAPIINVPLGVYPHGTKVEHSSRELIDIGPGIPFGISFMGDLWSEEKLVGMAYAFEQKTNTRSKLKRIIEPKKELKRRQ